MEKFRLDREKLNFYKQPESVEIEWDLEQLEEPEQDLDTSSLNAIQIKSQVKDSFEDVVEHSVVERRVFLF